MRDDAAHARLVPAGGRSRGHRRADGTDAAAWVAAWEAPAGSSILVSVLLRPPAERRAAELTLVAGVATAVVVERATGLAAQIKWPNDVMLDRRKVAGGLAELKDGAVVLGIGLNVNQRPDELPSETKTPAGSLRSVTGREYERAPILADLLLELELRYDAWRDGGIDALYDDLGARDFLRGRRVTVDGVAGHGADDRAGRPARGRDGVRPAARRERRGALRALRARPASPRPRAGPVRPRARAG